MSYIKGNRHFKTLICLQRKLQDLDLFHVSDFLSTDRDVTRLGIFLQVPAAEIKAQVYDCKSITQAAYYVLLSWHKTQEDDHVAWVTLGEALCKCKMEGVAKEVLCYSKPKKIEQRGDMEIGHTS